MFQIAIMEIASTVCVVHGPCSQTSHGAGCLNGKFTRHVDDAVRPDRASFAESSRFYLHASTLFGNCVGHILHQFPVKV